jgi:hypothetical protein
MKQFVKAVPKTGNCFKYLCKKVSSFVGGQTKGGVFVGPDIRKLMFDEDFLLRMTEVEREALDSLQNCCYQVPGEQKGP